MRKCGECGYLILGELDRCNHCGAALAAPAGAASVTPPAAATTPVSTSAAPPRFAAPPPSPAWSNAPAAPATPATPPTTMPGMYAPTQWAPAPNPVIQTQSRSGASPRAAIAVMMVVLLACGGIGYTFLAHRNALPSGTSSFVAGKGVVYSPADHAYTAQFPAQPKVDSQSNTVGGVNLTMHMALDANDDYEIGVGEMPLPGGISRAQSDELLSGALTGGATAAHLTLANQQKIAVDGSPAIDAHAKDDAGYPVRILVIATQRHLYFLVVHAKQGTDRLFDALRASFIAQDAAPA
jgi:hypothetical protein